MNKQIRNDVLEMISYINEVEGIFENYLPQLLMGGLIDLPMPDRTRFLDEE